MLLVRANVCFRPEPIFHLMARLPASLLVKGISDSRNFFVRRFAYGWHFFHKSIPRDLENPTM